MVIPILIMHLINPVALCSITVNQTTYVIAVEHGDVVTQKKLLQYEKYPYENTVWHVFVHDLKTQKYVEVFQGKVLLPVLKSLDLSYAKGQLYGLIETNHKIPALLVHWHDVDVNLQKIADTSYDIWPLMMNQKQSEKIQIRPEHTWSTMELGCREWLFNPALSVEPGSGRILTALNSADAGMVVWQKMEKTPPSGDLPILRGAVEPRMVHAAGRLFIMFREAPESWSSFYNTARYSRAKGPTPLDLKMAEYNLQGDLKNSLLLSKSLKIGDVVIFDFASDGKNRLGFVAVSGSSGALLLRLFVSENAGETWSQKESIDLAKVPTMLRLTINEREAVISMAQHEKDFYHYEMHIVRHLLSPQ